MEQALKRCTLLLRILRFQLVDGRSDAETLIKLSTIFLRYICCLTKSHWIIDPKGREKCLWSLGAPSCFSTPQTRCSDPSPVICLNISSDKGLHPAQIPWDTGMIGILCTSVEPQWTWPAAPGAFSSLYWPFLPQTAPESVNSGYSDKSGAKSTRDFKKCSLHENHHEMARPVLIGCIWTITMFKPSKTIKAENGQKGLKGFKG